jgi:hypothetical protein
MVDSGGVVRGRVAVTFFADCDFCAAGWDEINLE